jgi:hypothetical protein
MKKLLIFSLYAIIFAAIIKFIYTQYYVNWLEEVANEGGIPKAIENYKKNVDSIAIIFDLPPDYLMALIMLESSGRKKVPVRFEKSIYNELKKLQNGKIDKFENLTKSDIKGVKDKTIKALSSSYGPFQIMGYKKYILKISLDELKGNKNMYYAIKWIDMEYGEMLRDKEFKDAFHFHNVGKRHPLVGGSLTHDPEYVEKGLKYQKYFKEVIYKNRW